MSPVMTKVSGFPLNSPDCTVVSKVLGKQFSNSHANSGSAIDFLTCWILASTASLVNLRFASGGRRLGKEPPGRSNPRAESGASVFTAATAVVLRNDLR